MLMSLWHLIWGLKTSAIFDVWTIEHLMSGISFGYAVKKQQKRVFDSILGVNHSFHSWRLAIPGVLFLAYAWESIEHYLETGLMGITVQQWFAGVEFWPNRLIADPAMLVLGYVVAKKYPHLVIPARFFSLAWLLIHIFIFPDSMYLHQFI